MMNRIQTAAAIAALAILGVPLHARAETEGRRLAATCAACHGTDGRSVTTAVPGFEQLSREDIAQRMREFRDGKRPATVMHQLARGYTDRQIDQVAAYLETRRQGR
jgi:cytochrome subunit of sulfide dehydrogenase